MKSREGKYPPPDDLARLIRHWMTIWPNAQITSERMKQLYPYILRKWREGWTLAQIAQTACSCNDGQNIAPSPAALKVVPTRRLSLSPTGAVPGQTFGSDEIRDVASVNSLKLKKQVAVLQAQKLGLEIEIIYKRLAAAPDSGRANLEKQRQKLVSRQDEQRKVAEAADARLAELESTGRLSAVGRKPKAKKEPVQKAEPAPKPARQKRPAKATNPAPAAPVQAPSPPPAASMNAVEDTIAKLYEDD